MYTQNGDSDAWYCYLEDVNTLVNVASVTVYKNRSSYRIVGGLYGTYRLRCGQTGAHWGWARGEISNA